MNIQARIPIDLGGYEGYTVLPLHPDYDSPSAAAFPCHDDFPYPIVCDSNSSLSSNSADDRCMDEDRHSVEYFSFEAAATTSTSVQLMMHATSSTCSSDTQQYCHSRQQRESDRNTWWHNAISDCMSEIDGGKKDIAGDIIIEGDRWHRLSKIEMVEISLSMQDCTNNSLQDNNDDALSTERSSERDGVSKLMDHNDNATAAETAPGRGSRMIFLIIDEVKVVASCLNCYR